MSNQNVPILCVVSERRPINASADVVKKKVPVSAHIRKIEEDITLYAATGDIQIPPRERAMFRSKWQAEEHAREYVKSHVDEIAKALVKPYYSDENPLGGMVA